MEGGGVPSFVYRIIYIHWLILMLLIKCNARNKSTNGKICIAYVYVTCVDQHTIYNYGCLANHKSCVECFYRLRSVIYNSPILVRNVYLCG